MDAYEISEVTVRNVVRDHLKYAPDRQGGGGRQAGGGGRSH